MKSILKNTEILKNKDVKIIKRNDNESNFFFYTV